MRQRIRHGERPLHETFTALVHGHGTYGFKQICALLDEVPATVYKWCEGKNRIPAQTVIDLALSLTDYTIMHCMAERIGGTFTPPAETKETLRDLAGYCRDSTVAMATAAAALEDGVVSHEEVQEFEEALALQEAAGRATLARMRCSAGHSGDGRASSLASTAPDNVTTMTGRF